MKSENYDFTTVGDLAKSVQDNIGLATSPMTKLVASDSFRESLAAATKVSDSFTETMRSVAINLPKFEIPESVLITANAMKKLEDSTFKPPTSLLYKPDTDFNFDQHFINLDPRNTPHYRQQEELIEHIKEGNTQRLKETKEASKLKIQEIEDTNTKDKNIYKTIIYGLAIGLFAIIVSIGIYILEDMSDNQQHLEIMNSNKTEIARQNLVNKDQERRHKEELALLKQELDNKNSIIKELLSERKISKSPVEGK